MARHGNQRKEMKEKLRKGKDKKMKGNEMKGKKAMQKQQKAFLCHGLVHLPFWIEASLQVNTKLL